jgi:sugar phosphate permease
VAVATPVAGKRKIFYGWNVLAVTVLISIFGAVSAQVFTGAMLPYIEDDTGWSRSSITLAVTMGTMSGGFLAPFFGRLADKHGPRLMSSLGLLILALALFTLGLSSSVHIALFFVAYIVGRSTSQNMVGGVVARTTAVNWFRRMRGRALGLTQMAVPLGGAALIPVAQLLMGAGLSWQGVYYLFGAIMIVCLFPIAALVLRRRPEDIGLLPDGRLPGEPEEAFGGKRGQRANEVNWTLKQAMRTPALWLLIAAVTLGAAAGGALGFHQFSYYKEQGISPGVAALALSSYALSGAIANGLWGIMIERVSERLLGAATVTAAGLLLLFLLTVDSTIEAMVFAVLFGLMARGEGSIITAMEADYFGRESFGAISGFSAPFQQIALGLGPTIAAVIYDSSGRSYELAFITFSVLFFLSAGLIFLARKPTLRT